MTLLDKVKDLISRVENEAEKTDKRKLIDEIGGILKSAGADDEVIRTVIKKCEEIGYEESEAGTADNKKAKNADKEEKEEEFEEEKEIADNKKAKNEEKEEKEEEKEAENKCKNSMDDVKKAIMGGSSKVETGYIPHSKRLEMGNKY